MRTENLRDLRRAYEKQDEELRQEYARREESSSGFGPIVGRGLGVPQFLREADGSDEEDLLDQVLKSKKKIDQINEKYHAAAGESRAIHDRFLERKGAILEDKANPKPRFRDKIKFWLGIKQRPAEGGTHKELNVVHSGMEGVEGESTVITEGKKALESELKTSYKEFAELERAAHTMRTPTGWFDKWFNNLRPSAEVRNRYAEVKKRIVFLERLKREKEKAERK